MNLRIPLPTTVLQRLHIYSTEVNLILRKLSSMIVDQQIFCTIIFDIPLIASLQLLISLNNVLKIIRFVNKQFVGISYNNSYLSLSKNVDKLRANKNPSGSFIFIMWVLLHISKLFYLLLDVRIHETLCLSRNCK